MKIIISLFFVLLFIHQTSGQNIIKLSEQSDLILLAKVDSIFNKENAKYAKLTTLNSNVTKYIKIESKTTIARNYRRRYQINKKDTVLAFMSIKDNVLTLKLSINENPNLIYNSLLEFKNIKKNNGKLKAFKNWFVQSGTNQGIKPYLSKIMRDKKERDYLFSLIGETENKFIFSNSQKEVLTKSISKSRCLKFEDFYIVYLMRYSYDSKFEQHLKDIMATYCLPFGDAQLHMMETIIYNKKSDKLKEIYSRYRKKYFGNLEQAKKIYDEFINNI